MEELKKVQERIRENLRTLKVLLRQKKRQYNLEQKEYIIFSEEEFNDIDNILLSLSEDLGFIISLLDYVNSTTYQEEIINLVSKDIDLCQKEIYNSRYSVFRKEYIVNVIFFYTKFSSLISDMTLLLGMYDLLVAHILENELDLEMVRYEDKVRAEGTE